MNATEIAAALSTRAEDVCRRYLPRGRRQGRYWTIGDTSGAKGRSLFVRLAPPGIPGKWTDAATNQHGDLLDLIRLHTGGASLRQAMEEALAFLVPATVRLPTMAAITPAAMTAKKQRAAFGGVAGPSMVPMRKPICTPAPSAIVASRPYGFISISSIAADDGIHRLPALVAAVTGDDGAIEGVQRTWLDPKLPEKANLARPRKALGRVHGRARALRRVCLRHDPACRRGHRNRSIAGHRRPRH